MNFPLISIVIATYNSSQTLAAVLNSIKKQTYPQKNIEILVIDGGSTDNTLEIIKKYNCKIIYNPRIEPVNAKLLGYNAAKGKYLVFLDADEIIENPESLSKKYSAFKKSQKIKAVIGNGYKDPIKSTFITSYINEFGDPFSFFIYRLSKKSKYYYSGLKNIFPMLKEDAAFVIFDFSNKGGGLLLELGAANSMINLSYLKKVFPSLTPEVLAHLFQFLLSKSKLIAMTKNDPVIHYSTSHIKPYLNKINWRIKNNIYHRSKMGSSGFMGREQFHSNTLKFKKYLFIPYAYSLILPFIDSLWLCLSRHKVNYLLHLPLTFITANLIIYHSFAKIVGYNAILKNYDETKKIPS